MSRRSWLRDAGLMGLSYGSVSFLILEAASFGHPTGAVFWPGAGLTVGVLLSTPRYRWPALLSGVFVAEIVVDLAFSIPLGVAAIWAVANTVEPFLGALLLRREDSRFRLDGVAAVVRFLAFAVVIGPLIGATVGAIAASIAGVDSFWPTWPRWWTGDGVGVLLVAPAIVVARAADRTRRPVEEAAVLSVIGVVTLLAVFPWQVDAWAQGLPYLLAPAMVLGALRLDPKHAAIALAVSAIAINAVTASGIGPFAVAGTYSGLVVAQVCLGGSALALLAVIALNHDLLTSQQVERILREQALHDDLTGLANRRLLHERLALALAGLRRSRHVVAVLVIDLNGFKKLNDAHGHLAGDAVLVDVARRLRDAVRPTDTVARTGGDEFVVVMGDLPDPGAAEAFRDRLAQALHGSVAWGELELPLSASVGLAVADSPFAEPDDLLSEADRSMYSRKPATDPPAGSAGGVLRPSSEPHP